MQVIELWRFPVKSMGGERVEAARVTELGIEGDRRWGVFDVGTGFVLTARRAPALLFATARLVDGDVVVTLPDHGAVTSGDADAALSAWLGRAVELRRAGETGGTYENPMDAENDADWVSWTGPPGAWHDSTRSRVSLASTATLGDWDVRRFRTNVVVDGDGEDGFVGGRVRIGGDDGVELSVAKRIDRCVMVTRPQPGLGRDLDVLRTINGTRGACLAVGALVTSPGTIALGDAVERIAA